MSKKTHNLKIILAGTPSFSVPVFEEVIKNFDVLALVSQPDKPVGRGHKLQETPTKQLAKKYNIKVFQPNKISEIYEDLKLLDVDLFLTCAFGQIIPEKVLNIFPKGAINVHGSLLPKYRGAAPIQYSLLNGDKETGITLMYMVKEMDAGDMLFNAKVKIDEDDTSLSLFNKLSILAKENIVKWLEKIAKDQINPIKQNANEVTFSPKINKEEAFILNTDTVEKALNKIKAYVPFPIAKYKLDNQDIKVFKARKTKTIDKLEIKLKDGSIWIEEMQFPNKSKINYLDYKNRDINE